MLRWKKKSNVAGEVMRVFDAVRTGLKVSPHSSCFRRKNIFPAASAVCKRGESLQKWVSRNIENCLPKKKNILHSGENFPRRRCKKSPVLVQSPMHRCVFFWGGVVSSLSLRHSRRMEFATAAFSCSGCAKVEVVPEPRFFTNPVEAAQTVGVSFFT